MACVEYLGHAGFVLTHRGTRILIDPWFYPAFLKSWFPFPDNRFLLPGVEGQQFDFLYISHLHQDHFDKEFLVTLDRSVTVLCPDYRSKALARRLRGLGFERQLPLGHQQSADLGPGLRVTMFLDTSHKEDSGLLVESDGYRFLDLNDCNTTLSDLPGDIDLLAAQYSGAMWYPNCYDWPPETMKEKVETVRAGLLDCLVRKCEVTRARRYLPSAGPACFLDPVLHCYNDRSATIFPIWEDVQARFAAACPAIEVLSVLPGDRLQLDTSKTVIESHEGERPSEDFDSYAQRRRQEWGQFHEQPERTISREEIQSYFAKLQRRNRHLMRDFSKSFRLLAGGKMWGVCLGKVAEEFVIEGEEPYDPDYTLAVPARVLQAILDGEEGWEEALLSMRITLHRNPDVFDHKFMGLLRYGTEPIQTLQMSRELHAGAPTEMIERDGVRMQRFCPHAGEDLTFAHVCDGIIECPRHHWRWDAQTGRCVQGGTIPLKVKPAAEAQAVGSSGS